MVGDIRQDEGTHHLVHRYDAGRPEHVPPAIQVSLFEKVDTDVSKPLGPKEFLPLLLAVTPKVAAGGDPLTSTAVEHTRSSPSLSLSPADLPPFLNDLASGFADDTLADVLSPTLSFFFQEWFGITPPPDILGDDWRHYIGAVSLLVQVKGIAAIVSISGGPLVTPDTEA